MTWAMRWLGCVTLAGACAFAARAEAQEVECAPVRGDARKELAKLRRVVGMLLKQGVDSRLRACLQVVDPPVGGICDGDGFHLSSEDAQRADGVALAPGEGAQDGGVAVTDPGHLHQSGDGQPGGPAMQRRRRHVQARGEVVAMDDELDEACDEVVVEGQYEVAIDLHEAVRRHLWQAGPEPFGRGDPQSIDDCGVDDWLHHWAT